jgi:DNA polymerase III sliding clamp (beta) subunit (PCNA family)
MTESKGIVMETPNIFDQSVSVSSVLLKHEMKFMACLSLRKSDQMFQSMLLDASDGILHLTATDGHATVMTRLAVSGCGSFIVALDAKKLYAACERLPGQESQLSMSEGTLTLTSGTFLGRYKHVADAVTAIGSLTAIGASGHSAVFSAASILKLLTTIRAFVSRKSLFLKATGQDVGGAFLIIEDELVALAATGYRALAAYAARDRGLLSARVFISRAYVDLLLNITPDWRDDLFLGIHDADLRVECAPRVVVFRNALRASVPVFNLFKDFPPPLATATVNADAICGPVRRLRTASEGKTRPIELTTGPGKLILRASNENSFDGEEELDAETQGLGTCVVNANDVLQFAKGNLGKRLSVEIPAEPTTVQLRSGICRLLIQPVRMSKPTDKKTVDEAAENTDHSACQEMPQPESSAEVTPAEMENCSVEEGSNG